MIFSTLPSQQPFTYTWATKPPAAGNAGLEIIVSDLNNTKWRSDGTIYRPVNGVARVVHWKGSVAVTSATSARVAGVPTFTIPSDLSGYGLIVRPRIFLYRDVAVTLDTNGQIRLTPSTSPPNNGPNISAYNITSGSMGTFMVSDSKQLDTFGSSTQVTNNVTGSDAVFDTKNVQATSSFYGATFGVLANACRADGTDTIYVTGLEVEFRL